MFLCVFFSFCVVSFFVERTEKAYERKIRRKKSWKRRRLILWKGIQQCNCCSVTLAWPFCWRNWPRVLCTGVTSAKRQVLPDVSMAFPSPPVTHAHCKTFFFFFFFFFFFVTNLRFTKFLRWKVSHIEVIKKMKTKTTFASETFSDKLIVKKKKKKNLGKKERKTIFLAL